MDHDPAAGPRPLAAPLDLYPAAGWITVTPPLKAEYHPRPLWTLPYPPCVLVDAATKSRTTAKDVYCVAISRARQEARIYTDDKAKLPLAVARDRTKHAAMDLER